MRLLLGGLVLSVLLVACGSGDRVLHLGAGDFTEDEFREIVLAVFANPFAGQDACELLEDATPEEAANMVVTRQGRGVGELVQVPDPDDQKRAAEIMQEVCDSIIFESA